MGQWIREAWRGTRATTGRALGSPAIWFFVACYLAATAYNIWTDGLRDVLTTTFLQAFYLILLVLTILITVPMPPDDPSASHEASGPVWLQLVAILLFILLTGYTALAFHRLIPGSAANIPLWTPLLDAARRLGEANLPAQFFTSPGNSLVNPVQYFLLPFIVLLLLGASVSGLGFGRGHRSGWVILLWCGVEFALWTMQILSGALNPLRLFTILISNFFQNGFFEEFLFRGALQTRLRLLLDPAWALVLASLIFGLWHLGADVRQAGGDWAGGLALTIRSQAVLGLVFGGIFIRTRNLFACSVVHVALNTFFTT